MGGVKRRASGYEADKSPEPKIDVIDQKDIILPAVAELVRIDSELMSKYHEMKGMRAISASEQVDK